MHVVDVVTVCNYGIAAAAVTTIDIITQFRYFQSKIFFAIRLSINGYETQFPPARRSCAPENRKF